MNFVFISPNFPESYRWFCIRLRENGVNVLGVGDARYEELHPDLRAALTEYYKVDSLADYDQMVRALGHFTGEYGKLDWVESNNEFWLELDAALRTDFNITTGLKSDEIVKYKSKSLMKEYFKAAGVPAARFLKLTTLEAALAFTAETGYPVVVKPDSGVGATATYKLSSDDEVRDFFRTLPAEPYLMEEFVPGCATPGGRSSSPPATSLPTPSWTWSTRECPAATMWTGRSPRRWRRPAGRCSRPSTPNAGSSIWSSSVSRPTRRGWARRGTSWPWR